LFLNTLPFRLQLGSDESWTQLIRSTFQKEQAILAHRRYPLSEMQKTRQGRPLFETAFNFIHFHVYREISEVGRVKQLGLKAFLQTNFALATNFGLDLATGNVQIDLSYDPDELGLNQIESMAHCYLQVFAMMTGQPATVFGNSPLLSPGEIEQLRCWNETKTPYPVDKCVHELFEEQAANSPNAVAVIFEEEEVSYFDLNARANRLAHRLRALGVGPEVLVGFFVERSVEMVVGILAILKAGGAYVPLDPEDPMERLAFMSDDADLKVLLCHGVTREKLPKCAARILELDGEAEAIAGESSRNLERLAEPNNLAYVMYTSGSTGKPKGVCVEHGNIVRLVRNTNYVVLNEHQVLLQAAPISFDAPQPSSYGEACHSIPPDVDATRSIPIGSPISNTRVYILDAHMNPVPIGVPGELYAGGAGVARGYLNRPELTAEKFIPDPFSDDPNARLYRIGDLCRWLPDGTIEFLGRIDTQVKIRGFRIECGEVENSLLSYPDVREAAVDTRGEGADKQLVAWVSAARGNDADVGAIHVRAIHESPLRDELRAHLRASLPDWMIPAWFVFVDTLPLTPSGKIDRRALPAPEASGLPGTEYVAPISPTEELLAGLWAVVLKRETVGRFDNFFDLGGHSLLATQLISRIRDGFQVELPVRAVFEHPELSALAKAIESGSGLSYQLPPIEPRPANTPKSPSFAQQRLWFLDQFETGGAAAYNIPATMRFEGALDIDALQSSLHWMVERHESLRMAFPERGGEAGVVVLSAADFANLDFKFPVHDLRDPSLAGQSLQQRIDEHAAGPFDLARGPLFRAEILQLAKEDEQAEDGQAVHVLLINMHHIISDGWSIGVFIDEWRHAYIAFAGGQQPTLPPPPIQYSDYAHWQRQWLQG